MTDATPNGARTPATLEAELKDRIRWLCSIFGQPSELLRILTVAEWRRLRTWVRGLEALAAQLIRALAAAMPAPAAAPRPMASFSAERVAPDTDYPDSERWIGVCFRFRDTASAGAPSQIAPPSVARRAVLAREPDPRGFRCSRRLALRLEAVIRVAENATRYAKRLARRQARPQRAPRPTAPPSTPPVAPVTALAAPLRPPIVETG